MDLDSKVELVSKGSIKSFLRSMDDKMASAFAATFGLLVSMDEEFRLAEEAF